LWANEVAKRRKRYMTVDSAKQDVKVSFGQDFVIIGGDRVEVSPDGKR